MNKKDKLSQFVFFYKFLIKINKKKKKNFNAIDKKKKLRKEK